MNKIGDRVTILRDKYSEGSNKRFAELMNENSTTVSNWCKAESLGVQVILKIISKFQDIDARWLLTGTGEMIKDSKSDILIDNKEDTIDNNIEECKNIENSKEDKHIKVPFYSQLPVSAGCLEILDTKEHPEGFIKIPGIKAIASFPVVGFSMEPIIKAGDIIAVDEIHGFERLDPDKIYMIISKTNERMIKHLRADNDSREFIWAISPNYKEFKIYIEDIYKIYQVVYFGRLV